MVSLRRVRVWGLFVVLLLVSVAPGWGVGRGAAQGAVPEFGYVSAVALDASGSGWAWATSPPQTFFNGFLIRIEGGAWRVAASAEQNAGVVPSGAEATKIVLTGKGDFGWAIG
ncbi:MAG TPA: hypothetical protein VEY08_12175, partial [Chloroflexia bacterium]|nr:hypothetical protein [Chloroflexia bacterium]